MKKSVFNLLIIVAVCLCLCCCTLVITACDDNDKYKNISNDVSNYFVQAISLKSGEKYTFNVREIFKNSGLEIEKYKIEAADNKNYTVHGDTITAKGTGISSVSITLYCPSEQTRYVCSLGTLYSYDEKDFTPISTASQLQGVTDLNGKYILTADIDLGGIKNWQPIGNLPVDDTFTGMFINPNGYKIKNLTITSSEGVPHGQYGGCCGGLFGSVGEAFLYGINLENVNIDVSDFSGVSYSNAGGIASVTSGAYIKDCTVTGTVKAVGRTGGIVGSVNGGCIENCKFTGSVTSNEDFSEYALKSGEVGAGGIAGYIGIPNNLQPQYGLIACTANGTITAVNNAGGIAGYIWGSEFVKACVFDGTVSAASANNDFGTKQQ